MAKKCYCEQLVSFGLELEIYESKKRLVFAFLIWVNGFAATKHTTCSN